MAIGSNLVLFSCLNAMFVTSREIGLYTAMLDKIPVSPYEPASVIHIWFLASIHVDVIYIVGYMCGISYLLRIFLAGFSVGYVGKLHNEQPETRGGAGLRLGSCRAVCHYDSLPRPADRTLPPSNIIAPPPQTSTPLTSPTQALSTELRASNVETTKACFSQPQPPPAPRAGARATDTESPHARVPESTCFATRRWNSCRYLLYSARRTASPRRHGGEDCACASSERAYPDALLRRREPIAEA